MPVIDPNERHNPSGRPETVFINRTDLQAIDSAAIAHLHEVHRLRTAIAAERAAHTETRARLEALRAEHPPF